jgi:putative restriction endonuclease
MEQPKPHRYGLPWEREELIIAFDLYCRIPFRKTKANNPKVQELAACLERRFPQRLID